MSEALTEVEIAELRGDLEKLAGELDAQLERLGEDSRPVKLDQQAVGRLSRMDAMQQQQMAAANAGHIRAHLSRVRLPARLRCGSTGDRRARRALA